VFKLEREDRLEEELLNAEKSASTVATSIPPPNLSTNQSSMVNSGTTSNASTLTNINQHINAEITNNYEMGTNDGQQPTMIQHHPQHDQGNILRTLII
jgi:hypothetical protein